jgi:hypothetical protein
MGATARDSEPDGADGVELDRPGLELVTRLMVQVDPPVEAGTTGQGLRRIIPIRGGTATGPGFGGTIERGGADVQLIRPDGVAEVAARYIITTPRGTHVFLENTGVRHGPPEAMARIVRGEPVDPAEIYFRSVPRFETDDPELRWLERDLFVATGARFPDRVQIDVFHVT